MADEDDRRPYDDADPEAALRRLESLGRGGGDRSRRERTPPPEPSRGPAEEPPAGRERPPEGREQQAPAQREQAPARREEPPGADARPLPAKRASRPALAPDRSARLARLLAPLVFLAAVVIVFGLAWRSGVVGDGAGGAPVASPSPTASAKKSPTTEPTEDPGAAGTKTYTVKAGDTLSGIAERFDTTVTAIEDLNTDQDLQTLNPGQKLVVPAP